MSHDCARDSRAHVDICDIHTINNMVDDLLEGVRHAFVSPWPCSTHATHASSATSSLNSQPEENVKMTTTMMDSQAASDALATKLALELDAVSAGCESATSAAESILWGAPEGANTQSRAQARARVMVAMVDVGPTWT